MEKLFDVVNKVVELLEKAAPILAVVNPEAAKGIPAMVEDLKADAAALETLLKGVSGNRLAEWLKHHGNLPGTPESRGEV